MEGAAEAGGGGSGSLGDYHGGKASAEGATFGEAGFNTYGAFVFRWGVMWIEGVRAEGISRSRHADGENYTELWILTWDCENCIAQELEVLSWSRYVFYK